LDIEYRKKYRVPSSGKKGFVGVPDWNIKAKTVERVLKYITKMLLLISPQQPEAQDVVACVVLAGGWGPLHRAYPNVHFSSLLSPLECRYKVHFGDGPQHPILGLLEGLLHYRYGLQLCLHSRKQKMDYRCQIRQKTQL
jgi:hypothetical protein